MAHGGEQPLRPRDFALGWFCAKKAVEQRVGFNGGYG
jgi:hypothetical protein